MSKFVQALRREFSNNYDGKNKPTIISIINKQTLNIDSRNAVVRVVTKKL